MQGALRGYLGLASGLTQATRERAIASARALAAHGEATAGQAQSITHDLVATSQSNRAALTALVRYELDRALFRLGLATGEEVAAMAARLQAVEAEVRQLRAAVDGHETASAPSTTTKRGGSSAARARQPSRAKKTASSARAASAKKRSASTASTRQRARAGTA